MISSNPRCVLWVQLLCVLMSSIVECQLRRSVITNLAYELSDNTAPGVSVGHVGKDCGYYNDDDGGVAAGSGTNNATFEFMLRPGRPSQSSVISSDDVARLFRIDPITGSLSANKTIDRDVVCPEKPNCLVELNVQIRRLAASGLPPSFSFVKVAISLADDNDNPPTFQDGNDEAPEVTTRRIFLDVSEASAVGTRIAVLTAARDVDSPANGVRRYAISPSSEFVVYGNAKPEEVFGVEADTANGDDIYLTLRSELDRETIDFYSFSLVAYDAGIPPLSGSVSVFVSVVDANDNPPNFDRQHYDVSVPEDIQNGTVVLTVHATDPDVGPNGEVVYFLKRRNRKSASDADEAPFVVDPQTGSVSVSGSLDYETTNSYVLTILAGNVADGGGIAPGSVASSFAQAQVVINVTNVNDVIPSITFRGAFDYAPIDAVHVSEVLPVGSFIGHVIVSDEDPFDGVECNVDDEINFRLEELFGAEYQLLTAVALDRERRQSYDVTITCLDAVSSSHSVARQSLTGSIGISVYVDDINDNRPSFPVTEYHAHVFENQLPGTAVVQLTATDADTGRNAEIEYHLLESSSPVVALSTGNSFDFRLDPKTGMLTTGRAFDREREPVVKVSVVAVDSGVPALSATVDVTVYVGDVDDEYPQFSQAEHAFFVTEEFPSNGDDVIIGRLAAVDADLPPFNNITYAVEHGDGGVDVASFPFRITGNGDDGGTISIFQKVDREAVDHIRFKIAACSPEGRQCDTAHVTVYVTDINDNEPTFLFPLGNGNDTLYVGTEFRPDDDVIATLVAVDPDAEENGRVTYELITMSQDPTATTAESYFRLDAVTGDIFSRCEMLLPGVYVLPVAAVDGGGRSAESVLYIVVNASLPSIASGSRHKHHGGTLKTTSGRRFTTVIIIGGTTCPIVALLLLGICIVGRRRERRHRHAGLPVPPSSTGNVGRDFRKSQRGVAFGCDVVENQPQASSAAGYASLGRSRTNPERTGNGNAGIYRVVDHDGRGLSRSRNNIVGCRTSSYNPPGIRNNEARYSLISATMSRDAAAAVECRSSTASPVPVDARASGTATTTAVMSAEYELTDSGRGSSEEMSGRNVGNALVATESQVDDGLRKEYPGSRSSYSAPKNASTTLLNDLSRCHQPRPCPPSSTNVPDKSVAAANRPGQNLVTFSTSPQSPGRFYDNNDDSVTSRPVSRLMTSPTSVLAAGESSRPAVVYWTGSERRAASPYDSYV